MSILKTLDECIHLLSVDGENTKAVVKEKLEAIRLEICCLVRLMRSDEK